MNFAAISLMQAQSGRDGFINQVGPKSYSTSQGAANTATFARVLKQATTSLRRHSRSDHSNLPDSKLDKLETAKSSFKEANEPGSELQPTELQLLIRPECVGYEEIAGEQVEPLLPVTEEQLPLEEAIVVGISSVTPEATLEKSNLPGTSTSFPADLAMGAQTGRDNSITSATALAVDTAEIKELYPEANLPAGDQVEGGSPGTSRGGKHQVMESPMPAATEVSTDIPAQDRLEVQQDLPVDVKKLIDFETGRIKDSAGAESMQPPGQQGVEMSTLEANSGGNHLRESPITSPDRAERAGMDTRSIYEQVVKKLDLLVKEGRSEVRVILKPEFLGKLTIKVMVENDMVTARFIAESTQVKQMLEANLPQLKASLELNGMKMDRAEVSLSYPSGHEFQGQSDSGGQGNPSYRSDSGHGYASYLTDEVNPATEPEVDSIGSWGGVDYVV